MNKPKRTAAQIERQSQEHRASGKYAKVNPCEVCHKSAGADYYSDSRVDSSFHGLGLVLCERCSDTVGALGDEEALELLRSTHAQP